MKKISSHICPKKKHPKRHYRRITSNDGKLTDVNKLCISTPNFSLRSGQILVIFMVSSFECFIIFSSRKSSGNISIHSLRKKNVTSEIPNKAHSYSHSRGIYGKCSVSLFTNESHSTRLHRNDRESNMYFIPPSSILTQVSEYIVRQL